MLGRAQRGAPGDGPFDFTTGAGYVSPKMGDYAGALRIGLDVRPIIQEVTGGLHSLAVATLNAMTREYATRLDGTPEGGPRSRSYRAFHLARISAAAAQGLAFELAHGSGVLHAKLGLAC